MSTNKELQFNIQPQTQINWCWAANAASISLYYNSHSSWSQCRVCCTCLNRADCCSPIVPQPCNVPYYLDRALAVTGNFDQRIPAALSFTSIKNEIDNNQLIGVRIEWSNGNGHFVSVHGYNDTTGNDFVYVADPIYSKALISLHNFTNNYQNVGGAWTHSYLTKAAMVNMAQVTDMHNNIIAKGQQLNNIRMLEKRNFKISANNPMPATLPHEVYTINFNSLKDKDTPDITKTSVRLIDKGEKENALIYEFNDGDDNKSSLHQVITGESYTSPYQTALLNIEREQTKKNNTYQLRLIRQPELKTEAFWLHDETQEDKDEYIPVFSNDFLNTDTVYSRTVFINLLKKAAMEMPLYDDKEMGG